MEKNETKKEYNSPRLIELGNIVEITFGGAGPSGGDTFSERYPRSE